MDRKNSDLTFIVEGKKLFGHKIILAMRSPYFQALLYGGLSEAAQHEIELNVPLEAFKASLKYIYTGLVSLTEMEEEQILELLDLAEQYNLKTLKSAISKYLQMKLSQKNCCVFLMRLTCTIWRS